ncbi:ABC transporter permease [Lacticaseibacillus baoqingensis]|uniref:ABC transporter permease n=1 Tax=Lacticaseibacillus baoqingensis TaxID=2486013 RepID=A0ABW4E3U7_9LACO|nr:ABC transporter permease [Lacticaseibacillus baoqingensis]
MPKFWVVFSQVYKKNLHSGSWLFLVLSPLVFAALAGLMGYFIAQNVQPAQVAVVSSTPALRQAIVKTSDDQVHFRGYASAAKANTALNHETLDGILTVTTTPAIGAHYVERSNADQSVDTTTLTATLSRLKLQQTAAQLHLTAGQLAALLSPAKVTTKTVAIENGKQVAKNDTAAAVNRGFAMVLTVFIMIITMVYGSILAQEIATEKGSRIMEILLSSVSATTQFFGKLAGILALLVTQIVVYVVAGGLAWFFLRERDFVKGLLAQVDLSVLASPITLIAVLFFVIGVMTYAVLAALTGSLVSNQEQVQTAVMPISMLGLAGYFLAMIAQSGDSLLVQVASYVPFLNITVMPVQLALDHVGYGAAWTSLVIAGVFLIGFTWVVVGVYRSNVLVYSDAGFIKRLRTSLSIWQAERHPRA